MSIIGNPIITGGGNGNTEKPWNHVQFSVTSAEEQTKEFVIVNTEIITEILIWGTVLFDSYDGFCVFVNGADITANLTPSTTNRYVGFYAERKNEIWLGRGGVGQWNALNDSFGNNIKPYQENGGTGNIRISSRWINKNFIEGTSFDVWWR